MRRLMKFLHTMGAIGLMGAMACLLVLLAFTPNPSQIEPSQIAPYAQMRIAMGEIAKWVFLPSLAATLVAGLLAMAVNRTFHNAPWALVKLATGILVFEWGFAGIQGPMQEEAAQAARVLAGEADVSTLAQTLGAEQGSLAILFAIATLNVVLGVWRPRFAFLRRRERPSPASSPETAATPWWQSRRG